MTMGEAPDTGGRRVAVIGGGIAGLMAARRLEELGVTPMVFESSPRVGGPLRTTRRDGWLAESGPNTLMEPAPEVRALLDRIGLASQVVRPCSAVKRRYIVHEGALVPVPLSPGELVATPLLSVAGRLRLLKEPFVAKGGGDPDETVDTFSRRRFGDEVATRLIDPLVAGTSGADPTQVLVSVAFPRLVEYEQAAGSILKGAMRARSQARRRGEVLGGGLWSCRDGIGAIPTALAASLAEPVALGARVVAVRRSGEGFVVEVAGRPPIAVDGVCFACPASAYASMALDEIAPTELRGVRETPHTSLVTVSLGFRRDAVVHPLDGSGVLAPSSEHRRILGTLFPTSLFPDHAPEGHVLLTTFLGGMRHPEMMLHSDDTLLGIVCEELEALLGATGTPVFQALNRWQESLPVAVAGHVRRIAPVAEVEARIPRVGFVGAWRDGLSVHDVMLAGIRTAERVAAAFR